MTPLQAAKAHCSNYQPDGSAALQDFAYKVTKAREVFDAGRSMSAWLVFYELKQSAYVKLAAALPQVSEGQIKALRPTTKLWRVRQADLDAFLESGATIGGAE
jgi:hypothetical protein